MKVSVVIPVFNALDVLIDTLVSVINNTDHLYELILVDDCSGEPTRTFLDNLRIAEGLNVRLTKTRNPEHLWTNASWNHGVSLATGDFVAVLNSDITLSKHWDTELIRMLDKKYCSVACPIEQRGSKQITLDPLIQQVHPGMIKGACFMFRRQETKKFFPIPPELTHWCGDNYIADKAEQKGRGVAFCASATITHKTTQSGRLVDPVLYREVCTRDVLAYQEISGRDMSLIIKHMG